MLFSRFDVIHLVLATDFPDIPEDQRRNVTEALIPVCEPVFQAIPLGDDFALRPEYRQLKAELRTSIRNWFDDNGAPGYKIRLRHPKRVLSKNPLKNKR